MGFQQRWAEIDWVTTVQLTFSDGSTQDINIQQVPAFAHYPITPVDTDHVKVTITGVATPAGTQYTHPDGTSQEATCNSGAKEIEFYEGGDTPHGCYIGIQDTFRESRRTWSDGSPVNYANWAAGEPSPGSGIAGNGGENYGEMDFRTITRCNHGAGGYVASANNGCEGLETRDGKWNDVSGTDLSYFLCESNTYHSEMEFQYLGCYQDGTDCQDRGSGCRDMNGIQASAGQDAETMNSDPFFSMGTEGTPAKCAELCAGFVYFGVQYGSECYCDNANTLTAPDAETACDSPCSGDETTMCGGSWHNSVYRLGSQYWENAGYDDSAWEAAADLGHNGVAPWYKRPQISEEAKWIWSPDAQEADHVFCRFVQPNGDINCHAAQSQYWDDYPHVKAQSFPAFEHFKTVGRKAGNIWHSDLCNACSQQDYTTQCQVAESGENLDGGGNQIIGQNGYTQGAGPTSVQGQMQCDPNLCTNKCRGLHDAYDALMVGAVKQKDSSAYGKGIGNFINAVGDTMTFELYNCNAGTHRLGFRYSLAGHTGSADHLTCMDGSSCKTFGAGADPAGWGCCQAINPTTGGPRGGRKYCTSAQPFMCKGLANGAGAQDGDKDCEATAAMCADHGGAEDVRQRPIAVNVNGQAVGDGNPLDTRNGVPDPISFPLTGSWSEWGEVFVSAELISGHNTVTLQVTGDSGPNIDFMRVFPLNDYDMGTAHFNMDNQGWFYVNEVLAGTSSTNWQQTATFEFQADCSVPTVYSIHVLDFELSESSVRGVGGVIGAITHCGEVITTNKRWRCSAADMNGNIAGANSISPAWKSVAFDDSTWEIPGVLGSEDVSPWGLHDTYEAAKWIWTSDNEGHDDIFCRMVSDHKPVNCRDAADRYEQDYPEIMQQSEAARMTPVNHFKTFGREEGRIWHSEICSEKCGAQTTPFHWVDARLHGQEASHDDVTSTNGQTNLDDGFFDVVLPFAFPFFGQRKTHAKVSTNGYLTFSGEHTKCGNDQHDCGASFPIPGPQAPNDMIAPYWTDLDLSAGAIYTYTIDPTDSSSDAGTGQAGGDPAAGASATSCQHGIPAGAWTGSAGSTIGEGNTVHQACCASSCGTCGGTGCDLRPGGADYCCTQHVTMNAPSCEETGGAGPCNIVEHAFVIQWELETLSNAPGYNGRAGTAASFQVILYEKGAIKFQYNNVPFQSISYAPPSSGIENAAGNEGIQTSFNTQIAPQTAVLMADSCGATQTILSVGFCPGAWGANYHANGGMANSCTFQEADQFCADTYGGQLTSLNTQYEYDQIEKIIHGNADHFLLGMHSDGAGHWEYSDGTAADMEFLTEHSNDNLAGIGETNMVWFAGTNEDGYGGLHDCCPPTEGWQIEGFVCEHYAAPGTFMIGLNRAFEDAEAFCVSEYHGHLATVKTQTDYDRLLAMATGYDQPILLGGRSDGAGGWQWTDGSFWDNDFVTAHSWDSLLDSSGGMTEDQLVIYPPVCADEWVQPGGRADGQGCGAADTTGGEAEHDNHALHAWGHVAGNTPGSPPETYAYACSTGGSDFKPPVVVPGSTLPAGGGH